MLLVPPAAITLRVRLFVDGVFCLRCTLRAQVFYLMYLDAGAGGF